MNMGCYDCSREALVGTGDTQLGLGWIQYRIAEPSARTGVGRYLLGATEIGMRRLRKASCDLDAKHNSEQNQYWSHFHFNPHPKTFEGSPIPKQGRSFDKNIPHPEPWEWEWRAGTLTQKNLVTLTLERQANCCQSQFRWFLERECASMSMFMGCSTRTWG